MTQPAGAELHRVRPAVSVIMPVLDARPFLQASIRSILSQSFQDFELIVVDNGSSDGSAEYARSIADPRIRVLAESRRGAAYAINTGIMASRADLAAIMDADDICLRHRLMLQIDYLRTHAEVVLLGTRFAFIIDDAAFPASPPLTCHRAIRRALLDGAIPIAQGSTMFRVSAARQVGGHSFNGPAHDFDFFLRMGEVGEIHNLPALLYLYRLHNGSSTTETTGIITRHKRYAIACTRAREAGRAEPALWDFRDGSRIHVCFVVLADYARRMSAHLYRKALFQRARGMLVSAALNLIGSAVLNPIATVWQVKRRYSLMWLSVPFASSNGGHHP